MDVPPSYSAQPSGVAESDELPYPLFIGRGAIQTPFAIISQIKSHLCLLKHFAFLKERVKGVDRSKYRDAPEDKERRWSWFVGFERWCKELTSADEMDFANQCLPPVDVIMVWHAYLLNPAYDLHGGILKTPYETNTSRYLRVFQDLEQTCYTIDSPPSDARVQTQLQKTHVPYDPFESAIILTDREIACPQCLKKVNVRLADSNGTGYLQQDFRTRCTGCWLTITKEKLAFHKFVKDLVGPNDVLTGTLHTLDNTENSRRAKVVSDHECIRRDKIFSLDLIGAVLRQGSFVDKMHKLGWTEPDFFSSSEDEVALKHCTARYHA
ncbi:hypothetical protein EV421DRAFT_1901003 [Armillaria borealis]|uniref:Uncharacterized protein n=1 Tax=Armillaria borealis TaxID=47425 RepID=A0AA39MVK1_9AGAR|nr:hypothetical protein EV421DRAFT_1901003 [Armillaria borealis]